MVGSAESSLAARPEEEEEDEFPIDNTIPDRQLILDMEMIRNSSRPGPSSEATSDLASTVGTTLGSCRDAFLKDMTFWNSSNSDWGIQFLEPHQAPNANRVGKRNWLRAGKRYKDRLYIDTVGGVFTKSRIQHGDYLKSINGEKVEPSLNAELALTRMTAAMEKDGYLSVATANKELGDDILVQATIIKPRPGMKFEDMGMKVWYWGYLCIKSISENSVFAPTILRDTDHIISVNEIDCKEMRPEQFAIVVDRLPDDLTITVLRRKQRWIGKHS